MNSSLKKDQIIEEARIMKAIRHPYILSIKDIFDDDDNIYFILELATGGDLFDAVVTKGQYTEAEAKVLFGQLASAVGYLHDQGIAHRDLKPENILMTKEGGIKLSDFGLSKIIGEEQLMKTLCGTPKYLAPEIIFHSEGVTEGGYSKAVDCWSMGVILYILLAGYPPFGDDSFEDIKKGEFAFDDDPWETISKQAKDLINKLLTVNPSKRYTVAQIFSHPWMKGINRTHGDKDVDKNVVIEVKKSVSREPSKEEIPKSPKKSNKKATVESPKKSPKKSKKTDEAKSPAKSKRKPNKQDVDSDQEEEEEEEEEEVPKKKTKKGKTN